MMYLSRSKGMMNVEDMNEPHTINALRKLRRRLAASADRDTAEVAHDRAVLAAMEARASAHGWTIPQEEASDE